LNGDGFPGCRRDGHHGVEDLQTAAESGRESRVGLVSASEAADCRDKLDAKPSDCLEVRNVRGADDVDATPAGLDPGSATARRLVSSCLAMR